MKWVVVESALFLKWGMKVVVCISSLWDLEPIWSFTQFHVLRGVFIGIVNSFFFFCCEMFCNGNCLSLTLGTKQKQTPNWTKREGTNLNVSNRNTHFCNGIRLMNGVEFSSSSWTLRHGAWKVNLTWIETLHSLPSQILLSDGGNHNACERCHSGTDRRGYPLTCAPALQALWTRRRWQTCAMLKRVEGAHHWPWHCCPMVGTSPCYRWTPDSTRTT